MVDRLLLGNGTDRFLLGNDVDYLELGASPGVVEHFASVSFAASATLGSSAHQEHHAEVSLDASATFGTTAVRVAAWAAARFTARASLTPSITARGKKRRVVVTDAFGQVHGELENAKVGGITFELNRPDEWTFALPMSDPKAALVLEEKMREAQLWRGDLLLSWGPMIRPAADKKTLAVSGAGALWHLTRRHIGKAERTNYLTAGDFEDGPGGWGVGITSPLEPLANRSPSHYSWAIVTTRAMTGRRSLRLTQPNPAVPKYGISAGQSFVWEVDTEEAKDGDEWALVAYCFIPSDAWTAPHEGNRGLVLSRFSTTETVTFPPEGGGPAVTYPAPIEGVNAQIDDDTPRDTWVRLECVMKSPPTGEPEFVQVSLAGIVGTIYWDRASLTLDERLAFYEDDQTSVIAAGIVEHLQDPAYDKSDVNIGTRCEPSGVLRDRVYSHAEHPNGFDALEEFTNLDDGFDFAVAVTPTTRTFTTYAPQRGSYKPTLAFELGRNLADFAWAFDGEAAASALIVLGQGQGPAREEGFAIDPEAFSGGLTLEEVFAAPPDTPIDALDNVAAEKLAVVRSPEVLALKTTTRAAAMIGRLWPGDTVPVRIQVGALSIDDVYRVIRLTLNPNDTLDVVVNRRDPAT